MGNEQKLETYRVYNNHHNISTNVKATSTTHAREIAVGLDNRFKHRDTFAEKSWIHENIVENEHHADNILSHLSAAHHKIMTSNVYSSDGKHKVDNIHYHLRKNLMSGDVPKFKHTWEFYAGHEPDAFDEYANHAFDHAGLGHNGTFDEFLHKTMNEMKRIKSYSDILNEIYGRSPTHAARGISQRIASKGIGLAAKAEDDDPEYHREQAEQLKSAIANNPSWAHLMLPKMQERLAYHEKRHVELMATEEKSKDRANARKEESLDEYEDDVHHYLVGMSGQNLTANTTRPHFNSEQDAKEYQKKYKHISHIKSAKIVKGRSDMYGFVTRIDESTDFDDANARKEESIDESNLVGKFSKDGVTHYLWNKSIGGYSYSLTHGQNKSFKKIKDLNMDLQSARDNLSKEGYKEEKLSESELNEGKFDTQVSSDEFDRVGHHMANKDLNVTHVYTSKVTGGKIIHVRVNNLPTDKYNMVHEKDYYNAENHLKKLGDNYKLHTLQPISSTGGGRFEDSKYGND